MIKQNLKNSDSFTKKFIRRDVTENKRLLIILSVLQLLGIPAIMITFCADCIMSKKRIYSGNSLILYIVFGISFAIASILGIYTALKSFSYLYKKTHADKIMVLPLTTKQRFTGSYLSGLLIYTIPYIASIFLSTIIISFIRNNSDMPYSTGELEAGFLLFAVIVLLTMIMLYTTTVFTCSCCGSILESVVYTILLNAGIPLFVYIISIISYSNIPGVFPELEALDPLLLSGTFGGPYNIYNIIDTLDSANDAYDVVLKPMLFGIIIWMIKYIIIIAIIITISFILYKKRKAEDISKPFVHSFIYFIFIILSVISIEGLCIFKKLSIVGVIASFVMYITLDLIKTRGLKNIKNHSVSFLCYLLSLGAAFAIVKISTATEGFGKKNYIPDENTIKSITLSVPRRGFGCDKSIYNERINNLTLTDKDSIEQIIKMHQAAIEFYNAQSLNISNYMEFENQSYELQDEYDYEEINNTVPATLSYLTGSGKKIRRCFYIPLEEWYKTTLVLAENESMKKNIADDFERFINTQSKYLKCIEHSLLPVYSKYDKTNINNEVYCDETEKLREIGECYRKDIMNVTKEDLLDLKTYCMIDTYYIPECFKNTIAALNKYKVSVDENNDSLYKEDYQKVSMCHSSQTKEIYLNTGDIHTVSLCYHMGHNYFYNYDKDCLKSLLRVAEPNYYTYEDCYILEFDQNNYIIPPEYSSVAEKFIETADCSGIKIETEDE